MLRKAILPAAVLAAICIACVARADDAATAQATRAADEWLKLVDDGAYRESWNQAAGLFKDHVSADQWAQMAGAVRKPLGVLVSRKLKSARYATSLPGAPDGQYVVIQYDTSFEHKKAAIETVTPMMDKDGNWRVSGYYIK
jgi:uncharacterized protein DUF4019